MKIPVSYTHLTLPIKDKSGLIKYLKEIRDSPVSPSDIKAREEKRKVGIIIKKLEKLK